MSYFIYTGQIRSGCTFALVGPEAAHLLSSRRMRVEEEVEIQDERGRRYQCRIARIARKELVLQALKQLTPPPEPSCKITLYQAMMKERGLEILLQKATELGCHRLVLFESRYSQRLPVGKEREKKLIRWERIGQEAAKQSGRLWPCELRLHAGFPPLGERAFLFHPRGNRQSWAEIPKELTKVALCLGPEGGFAEEELPPGVGLLGLGPRVLKAETAAITALGLMQHLLGDLS